MVPIGSAQWAMAGSNADVPAGYFAVADAADDTRLLVRADAERTTRVILIQVPTELGYLLYNKLRVL